MEEIVVTGGDDTAVCIAVVLIEGGHWEARLPHSIVILRPLSQLEVNLYVPRHDRIKPSLIIRHL